MRGIVLFGEVANDNLQRILKSILTWLEEPRLLQDPEMVPLYNVRLRNPILLGWVEGGRRV